MCNKVRLPRAQHPQLLQPWGGYTYAVRCMYIEVGLIPGSPFTISVQIPKLTNTAFLQLLPHLIWLQTQFQRRQDRFETLECVNLGLSVHSSYLSLGQSPHTEKAGHGKFQVAIYYYKMRFVTPASVQCGFVYMGTPGSFPCANNQVPGHRKTWLSRSFPAF